MKTIRQHGSDGTLYDINSFLDDIDEYFNATYWIAGNLDLLGENALEVEKYFGGGRKVPDHEFRKLYQGIYQTIWGDFELISGPAVSIKLHAIDSTCWDIECEKTEFLIHMEEKYGRYLPPNKS